MEPSYNKIDKLHSRSGKTRGVVVSVVVCFKERRDLLQANIIVYMEVNVWWEIVSIDLTCIADIAEDYQLDTLIEAAL